MALCPEARACTDLLVHLVCGGGIECRNTQVDTDTPSPLYSRVIKEAWVPFTKQCVSELLTTGMVVWRLVPWSPKEDDESFVMVPEVIPAPLYILRRSYWRTGLPEYEAKLVHRAEAEKLNDLSVYVLNNPTEGGLVVSAAATALPTVRAGVEFLDNLRAADASASHPTYLLGKTTSSADKSSLTTRIIDSHNAGMDYAGTTREDPVDQMERVQDAFVQSYQRQTHRINASRETDPRQRMDGSAIPFPHSAITAPIVLMPDDYSHVVPTQSGVVCNTKTFKEITLHDVCVAFGVPSIYISQQNTSRDTSPILASTVLATTTRQLRDTVQSIVNQAAAKVVPGDELTMVPVCDPFVTMELVSSEMIPKEDALALFNPTFGTQYIIEKEDE